MRKSTVTQTAHPAAAQNAPRPTCHRDATLWLQARLQDSTLCDMLARAHPDYSRPHAWRHLDDHVAALAGTVVAQVVAHAQTAALVPVDELSPEQVAARWTRFHGGGTIALYAGGGWLSITRNGRPQKSFPVKRARFVLAQNETDEVRIAGPRSRSQASIMADLARTYGAGTFKAMGAVTGRARGVAKCPWDAIHDTGLELAGDTRRLRELKRRPTRRVYRVSTDIGRGVRGIAASAAAILARRAKAGR